MKLYLSDFVKYVEGHPIRIVEPIVEVRVHDVIVDKEAASHFLHWSEKLDNDDKMYGDFMNVTKFVNERQEDLPEELSGNEDLCPDTVYLMSGEIFETVQELLEFIAKQVGSE